MANRHAAIREDHSSRGASCFRRRNPVKVRVAGVDPGTIRTGVGILEQEDGGKAQWIHAETIEANQKRPVPERLRKIYGGLKEVFMIYRPSAVAIENIFFSKDFKAAIKIGEARAVAMLAAMELEIPVVEYMPNRIKEAVCGTGRAAKPQVQFMIKKLLNLTREPDPDSADALAIAFCHLQTSQWERKKELLTAR